MFDQISHVPITQIKREQMKTFVECAQKMQEVLDEFEEDE